jgi:hypothetical protein
MVQIAIKDEPGFELSSIEGDWAEQGKKSFTIAEIKAECGQRFA